MLVPGGVFPGLSAPLAHLLGGILVVSQEAAAGAAGDDLVSVKGDDVVFSKGTGLPSLIACTQGLRRILHQDRGVLLDHRIQLVNFARGTVQVGNHHDSSIRVNFKCLLQCRRIHVPRIVLRVDKHRLAALVDHGIDCSIEGHVGAENLLPFQRTMPHLGYAIGLDARQLHRQMQRCRACCQRHGVFAADLLADQPLRLVNIFAHSGHPVGVVCLTHVFQLCPMHGRAAEPDLTFKFGKSVCFCKHMPCLPLIKMLKGFNTRLLYLKHVHIAIAKTHTEKKLPEMSGGFVESLRNMLRFWKSRV